MKDLKGEVAQPRWVALYMYTKGNPWFYVGEVNYSKFSERYEPLPEGQVREEPRDGFTRVSEPIKVNFTALNEDAVIEQAVASLNAEERRTIEELNKKLADIRGRKAQLLALTHQSK